MLQRLGATTTRVAVAASTPSSGRASSQPQEERDKPVGGYNVASNEWFFTEAGQKGWIEAMELDTLTPDLPVLLKEMGIKYDPDRLAGVLSERWPQVYGRALLVTASLGGWIARVMRDAVTGRLEANAPRRAADLRTVLSRLGPSFVKIGQALSSRPDLLPKTYLDTLADLQDRLPSYPNEIALTVIEEELGRPLSEMFSSFSDAPVAAASLGQVYKATLAATGEEVAVKVQRPGIGESIAVDMLLLRRLMGVIDTRALPALGISQPLVPLVDEFAARLFAELDYIQEGRNAEKFQELYGNVPRVRTPGIKWGYTSRRVITMEWIDGVKLTDKQAMDAAGLSVVDFVNVGIECTLRQLLDHGFFHADPHPGNLLATTSGDLCYLDFGLMAEAPQYARFAIIAHVVHLVNRDYEAMCRDYYQLQFVDRSVDTSPIAPALAAFFDDVLDQSVSQLNFKSIVDGLGDVLFRYPFRVPAYYALILRCLTVLEGLALQADPKYKLLAQAYPYMASRLLTDPSVELRGSFEELILKDGAFRWNRLENLLREGSKSQAFDPAQLWLLAEWLLSPNATSVRESIVAEAARMVDAVAASDVRERIVQQTGSFSVAERLVPPQPSEAEALSRARLLVDAVRSRLDSPPGTAQLAETAGAVPPQAPAPQTARQPTDQLLKGSGPFGLLTPGDVQKLVGQARAAADDMMPRVSRLLRNPGVGELAQSTASHLIRRMTARTIKLVFGLQALATGAGGASAADAGQAAPVGQLGKAGKA